VQPLCAGPDRDAVRAPVLLAVHLQVAAGRGLHSSTSQLNLSRF